jgi:hypothetical protein
MERLSATSIPDRVVYCSSQELTEDKLDKIVAEIRRAMPPKTSVLALGGLQLARLTEKYSDVFEKFYGAEIKNIQSRLLSLQTGQESTEAKGLRLALVAFGSEDTAAFRLAISKRAVLETLVHLDKADVAAIAQKLSTDLCLPRPLNAGYMQMVLVQMRHEGLAVEDADDWLLTARGREECSKIPPEAAQGLLAGQTIIREELQEATGLSLADDQFERIWSALLDFLSGLFYSNGLAIIGVVSSLLDPHASKDVRPATIDKLIADGARRVGATMSSPELAEEVEQAILDMFTERSGSAFEWLARVCERFVALCALGLEGTSADEIRAVLRRHKIVLDSDIVISLLCDAETDNKSVRELMGQWRSLGGTILLATPVLEEVAYHAWISEKDFRETQHLVGKLKKAELRRYAENAFVRTFHWHVRSPSEARRWNMYINQYRGRERTDYGNLLGTLQEDLAAQLLPSDYDSALKKEMTEFLHQLVAASRGISIHDLTNRDSGKAERDGMLLASIAATRETQRQSASGATIVLLSSSGRIRRADEKFRARLGSPDAVVTRGALSYLLAIVPDVSLGAGALRRALFEFGRTAHLHDTERFALRIIRSAGQYELPWARRRTLQRELEKVLHIEAKKRDEKIDRFRKKFVAGDKSARPAEMIATALRNIAISDSVTEKLTDAHRTIKILEIQVDELKQQLTRQRKV